MFGPVLSSTLHEAMLGVGVVVLVLIFGGASVLPAWTRSHAALAPVFALVILGGAGAGRTLPLLTSPVLVLLGEASYSIYILHIPLRYCWQVVVETVLGVVLAPWLDFFLYFGFVVVVSLAVFRGIRDADAEVDCRSRSRAVASRCRRNGGRLEETRRDFAYRKTVRQRSQRPSLGVHP